VTPEPRSPSNKQELLRIASSSAYLPGSHSSTRLAVLAAEWLQESTMGPGSLADAYHVETAIIRAFQGKLHSKRVSPCLLACLPCLLHACSGECLQPLHCITEAPRTPPSPSPIKLPSEYRRRPLHLKPHWVQQSVDIIPLSQSRGLRHQTHLLNPSACAQSTFSFVPFMLSEIPQLAGCLGSRRHA
jgi:hypothetical protein